MAKKRKVEKKFPKCPICEGAVRLKTIIPAAHIFPEMRTFQCACCGYLRTVENESELAHPPWVLAATQKAARNI